MVPFLISIGVPLDIRPLSIRQDVKVMVLFLIVQFVGLILVMQVYNNQPQVIIQTYQVSGAPPNLVFAYATVVIISALVLIIILRNATPRFFFLLIEAFFVLLGSFFTFLVAVASLFNLAPQIIISFLFLYIPTSAVALVFAAAALLSILLLVAKWKFPRLRNLVVIISAIGIGTIIGLEISFVLAVIFLLILAVYDYVAVFITKHMVAMGQAAMRMNLALMVGVTDAEAVPRDSLSEKERKLVAQQKPAFAAHRPILRELAKEKRVPLIGMRGLGNGDLAMPLVLAIPAYQITLSFLAPLVVVIGAAFGLALNFIVIEKYRRMLPAIPLLAVGMFAALGIFAVFSVL